MENSMVSCDCVPMTSVADYTRIRTMQKSDAAGHPRNERSYLWTLGVLLASALIVASAMTGRDDLVRVLSMYRGMSPTPGACESAKPGGPPLLRVLADPGEDGR